MGKRPDARLPSASREDPGSPRQKLKVDGKKPMEVEGGASGSGSKDKEKEAAKDKDKEKKGKGKGKGSLKITSERVLKAFPVMMKASCFTMQGIREGEACYFDVALIGSESRMVEEMAARTKAWQEEVEAKGKGHDCGPPFLRAWEGLLVALSEGDVGAVNKMKVKEAIDLTTANKDSAYLMVRACRARKAYDPAKRKLVLAVRGEMEKFRVPIMDSIKQLGGEIKTGKAPPSGLEKAIQVLMENWKS
jgi:hypothetical protein